MSSPSSPNRPVPLPLQPSAPRGRLTDPAAHARRLQPRRLGHEWCGPLHRSTMGSASSSPPVSKITPTSTGGVSPEPGAPRCSHPCPAARGRLADPTRGGDLRRDFSPSSRRGPARPAVRYWDKAASEDGGARTAGCASPEAPRALLRRAGNRRSLVGPTARAIMRQTAEADGRGVSIWIEQEPGSGGKESAETSVRNLAGFSVHPDRVSGDKVSAPDPSPPRPRPATCKLVRGAWNRATWRSSAPFRWASSKTRSMPPREPSTSSPGALLDAQGDRSLGAAGGRGENRCGREPTVDEMLTPGG